MTYDERKMCNAYSSLIAIADGIQHIYKVGADEVLSKESRRKLAHAEDDVSDVMREVYKYVADHTHDNSPE